MTFLRTVFCLAAVATPVISECASGSCPDETSLMQMKQVVKHAGERDPGSGPSPVHDDKALIKGLSTHGDQLGAVLDANIAKMRAEVESKAADDIDFQDKTMNAQRKLQKDADDKIATIKKNYHAAVAHEGDKLKATKAKRAAVKAAASKRVKDAKTAADAAYLKKQDAADIAVLGRQIGKEEGEDAEDHAWEEYENDYQNSQDQKAREQEREAIAKQTAEDREGQADLGNLKKEYNDYIKQQRRDYQIRKADADAQAHEQRYELSGPEGINNRVTNIEADKDKKRYDRRASNAESVIEHAAAGDYPAGDWPEGPGDSPLAAEERASLAEIPNEGAWMSTPVHDDEAIADSTPDSLDAGQVEGAFAANADKVRAQIESNAADNIDFTNKQRVERKESHQHAEAKIAANKEATEAAREADQAAVAAAKKERKAVIDAAEARVKDAKENARAHAIKRAQAERAAALGRRVGTIEGRDAARHAWEDYREDVTEQKQQAAREAARDKIAAHEASLRSAVEKRTQAMKAADDARVAAADRAKTVNEAEAAADAAEEEESIEGSEGLKNKVTDIKADWADKHYDRETEKDQAVIDKAAAGEYPAGDWPVGPGDDPTIAALDDPIDDPDMV